MVERKDEIPQLLRAMRAYDDCRIDSSKREGWNRFCEQLGVSPDSITAPFVEHCQWAMEAAEAVCETLELDEDDTISGKVAERELEALLAAWE